MPVDPPYVLSYLCVNGIEEPIIYAVECVGEDKLGPGEDSKFICGGVERVSVGGMRWIIRSRGRGRCGRLVSAATPYT